MISTSFVADLTPALRILLIVVVAVLGHFLVQTTRTLAERILAGAGDPRLARKAAVAKRYPKFATITSLIVSALTFFIYFGAVGLVLHEVFPRLDLGTYLATAGVMGLAVAFGLQGLIQDIVIGLTLVFTDAFDVGDMIELSGSGVTAQVGRVERIGLRFTVMTNFQGQRVFVPNRNIVLVSQFRAGVIRAYVDIQIPAGLEDDVVRERVESIARGFQSQHRAALVTEHEIFGTFVVEGGGWRYLRLRFRLWPGQGALVENLFRQRILAAVRELEPDYQDWMVSVTYRVE
ncbi:MAG: mechanosensitive ion channel [Gemmatimonadetes bacterium]|nr:mechanosensitive ion channel family protein [Gemmatimonadota bacterium]NNM04511.1 mechanosensitive ion channel [Gemmatimonadota bacterium]